MTAFIRLGQQFVRNSARQPQPIRPPTVSGRAECDVAGLCVQLHPKAGLSQSVTAALPTRACVTFPTAERPLPLMSASVPKLGHLLICFLFFKKILFLYLVERDSKSSTPIDTGGTS
eukprot:SAG31_NODE_1842_length_7110_cov_46.326202_4_plen_117_part_00